MSSVPGRGELGLERVTTATGNWSLVGWERSEAAQKQRQLSLGTEKCPFPSNDRIECRGRVELRRRSCSDVVDRVLRCHTAIRPRLPDSGHEKTPRQGRGVSTWYHPASPACQRARICPLTMGLGTTTQRAWRLHRPAREGISPPRHPAVLSLDRRPCLARQRVLVSVNAISLDVVGQYSKGRGVTNKPCATSTLYSWPFAKRRESAGVFDD